MTQQQLADRSGVSIRTIQMFENGADIKLSNLIKLLEAVDLSDNINMLIPDVTKRPSYEIMSMEGNLPKRVRRKKEKLSNSSFKWGED